ncbi:hypothetical protein MKW92_044185 [Papaver armeniacum]|nr:hypothetical protein MKW92_044185 [Papaver armeniacum]
MEEIVGVSACVLGDMASCPNFGLNELDFVFLTLVVGSIFEFRSSVSVSPNNGNKMNPYLERPKKPQPTLFYAMIWETHMGLRSNFRYQTLNGIEFLLAKGLPPVVFKGSVIVFRCTNNVFGGVSFVTLAWLTGSQKVKGKPVVSIKEDVEEETRTAEEKVNLVEEK